jgi:hypothetical protein
MKIMQFLKDPQGDLSSKRLYGIACFIVATVIAFTIQNEVLTASFLASASAVFIAQSFTGK